MISPEQAHDGINLGLHVWILFTFLTIFFFTFISRKEKEAVTRELNIAIKSSVPIVLDNIDNINKKIGGHINWQKVSDVGKKIEQKYKGPDPAIKKHNKKLIEIAILVCIILFILLIGAILYFVVYKKYDIGLKTILIDNFIVAIFIGIIEALFFLNIALKYSPVTTSDIVNQIITRTEYHIAKETALHS